MARKRRDDYRVLRARLRDLGIADPAAIERVATNARRTAAGVAATVALVAALVALVVPAVAVPVLVVATLTLAWLGSQYLTMRTNLKRYRAEVAVDGRPGDP